MIQTILLTALSTQLTFAKPSETPTPPSPQVVFTRVLPQENYVSYVVAKNDTLKSIALTYYGAEDNWKTLVQDNPNVSDTLTEGSLLKIRVINSEKTNVLSTQDMQINPMPTATYTPIPTTMPTVETAPTSMPTIAVSNSTSSISDEAITYLGNCEAGMNPTRNSGNGYYGAFQFSYGTWKSMNTGYERADLAPIEVQEAAVKQLLQRSSIYNQFPGCARKMHSAGLI